VDGDPRIDIGWRQNAGVPLPGQQHLERIEAIFTALLLLGLLGAGLVTLSDLGSALPPAGTALVIAGAVGQAFWTYWTTLL
jgi:hypothetical protein